MTFLKKHLFPYSQTRVSFKAKNKLVIVPYVALENGQTDKTLFSAHSCIKQAIIESLPYPVANTLLAFKNFKGG